MRKRIPVFLRMRFLITLAGCFFGIVLSGQVLNVEGQRFVNDTNGWVGRVGFSFQLLQNTKQVIGLGNAVHVQYRHNRHRVLLLSDLNFIRAGGTDFVNTGYQHIRYNNKLNEHLTWEFFVQTQYNKVLLMDFRGLAGTGPRVKLLKKENLHLYAAALYMFEHEQITGDSITFNDHRMSSYVTNTWILSKHADWSATVFYQPNLGNFSDMRIAGDMALDINITKKLGFRTTFNFLYDNKQPAGVPEWTYQLKNSIDWHF